VIGSNDAAGIAQMRFEGEIELLALIDLVDGHQGTFLHLAPHHRVGTRSRKDEAERNGRLCHPGGPVMCVRLCRGESFVCHLLGATARIVRRPLKKVSPSQLTSPERLRHNSLPGKYVHDERVLAQPTTSE